MRAIDGANAQRRDRASVPRDEDQKGTRCKSAAAPAAV